MKPKAWFTRKFDHIHDPGIFPGIIERLRGTPARLEELIQKTHPGIYTIKRDNDWAVQEHAGHLLDLEPLWYGRVGDILAGKEILREADLTNRKTHEAGHNERPFGEILAEFREARMNLTGLLAVLPEKDFEKSALHPRLMTPMKMIDLAYFVAEHDDHHLAMISWLESELGG